MHAVSPVAFLQKIQNKVLIVGRPRCLQVINSAVFHMTGDSSGRSANQPLLSTVIQQSRFQFLGQLRINIFHIIAVSKSRCFSAAAVGNGIFGQILAIFQIGIVDSGAALRNFFQKISGVKQIFFTLCVNIQRAGSTAAGKLIFTGKALLGIQIRIRRRPAVVFINAQRYASQIGNIGVGTVLENFAFGFGFGPHPLQIHLFQLTIPLGGNYDFIARGIILNPQPLFCCGEQTVTPPRAHIIFRRRKIQRQCSHHHHGDQQTPSQ